MRPLQIPCSAVTANPIKMSLRYVRIVSKLHEASSLTSFRRTTGTSPWGQYMAKKGLRIELRTPRNQFGLNRTPPALSMVAKCSIVRTSIWCGRAHAKMEVSSEMKATYQITLNWFHRRPELGTIDRKWMPHFKETYSRESTLFISKHSSPSCTPKLLEDPTCRRSDQHRSTLKKVYNK